MFRFNLVAFGLDGNNLKMRGALHVFWNHVTLILRGWVCDGNCYPFGSSADPFSDLGLSPRLPHAPKCNQAWKQKGNRNRKVPRKNKI